MMQLAFDFMAPPPAPAPPPPDPLAQALIAAGLVPNDFLLRLNRGLTNPDDLALPSRLFRFPVAFESRDERQDGQSKLFLRHPDLVELPFVQRVADTLGIAPEWEPLDEYGRDRGAHPRWWHAVDLCTEKHWRDLLETRRFTDRQCILRAVEFAMGRQAGARIAIRTARTMLAELESPEPSDRSEAALLCGVFLSPGKYTTDQKMKPLPAPYWVPNLHGDPEVTVWAMLHGIEDGWFEFKGDHLRISKAGAERLQLQ